jgi:SAM-dependent methyltransferase
MRQDPLAGSNWSRPETVAGFVASPPNERLMHTAAAELARIGTGHLLDVGCGAGRNGLPLAAFGWRVVGLDLSIPMLEAAGERAARGEWFRTALAPMDCLPIADRSCDMVVAHGIWNLARSGAEFRRAVREAARVAIEGAPLFVFTFSRNTLPGEARPVQGEAFVYTDFSGAPQCFLTEEQLIAELTMCGFEGDPSFPLRELNRRAPSATLGVSRTPVIYEGVFRRTGAVVAQPLS